MEISVSLVMKIFFCSTATSQTTGYARISHVLLNDLARRGHDVTHFAFQHYQAGGIERPMHPNITVIDVTAKAKQTFGYDIVAQEVQRVAPDVVIVYNDMIVTTHILNALEGLPKTFRFISYLDLVYPYQDWTLIQFIKDRADHLFVFSDTWKSNLIEMGVPPEKLDVFPHGFDTERFFHIPHHEARKRLGLGLDDFLVLNTNRNSYRKALDVTIRSFLMFLHTVGCPETVKLMLNCRMDVTEGYDMLHVIRIECLKLGLDYDRIVNHHIIQLGRPGLVDEDTMNALYNACDIGINTCLGEGFGLCNVEHAGLGAPQIVSRVGGLADIFKTHGCTIEPITRITLARCIDTHSGELSIPDAERFAAALQMYYENTEKRVADGKALQTHIRETYHWPTLLETFHTRLLDVSQASSSSFPGVYWINRDARTDRRKHMLKQFQTLGIADHTRISPQEDAHPHVSCMYGHYKAIYTAYMDGRDCAVFAEDDVVLHDRSLSLPLDKLPADWECVQLHYANPNMLKAILEKHPHQGFFKGYAMSCAYYVMNRRGMRRFIERMGLNGTLTAPIDIDTARAEELVYRYVTTYCLVYPIANTDETLGSDIPSSYTKDENASLIDRLEVPRTWSVHPIVLPYDTHWNDSIDDAKALLQPQKQYTRVWNDPFIYNTRHLANLDLCIEFGCFEGLTSNYMCDKLTSETGTVVCVDPLDDTYEDIGSDPGMFQNQYDRFMHNTAHHRRTGKLVHIRQKTHEARESLLKSYGNTADLVYVDGDHTAKGTYEDGLLAFRLCKPGGTIIFDDYGWPHGESDITQHPRTGIELFLSDFAQDLIVRVKNYQVVVQKKV